MFDISNWALKNWILPRLWAAAQAISRYMFSTQQTLVGGVVFAVSSLLIFNKCQAASGLCSTHREEWPAWCKLYRLVGDLMCALTNLQCFLDTLVILHSIYISIHSFLIFLLQNKGNVTSWKCFRVKYVKQNQRALYPPLHCLCSLLFSHHWHPYNCAQPVLADGWKM